MIEKFETNEEKENDNIEKNFIRKKNKKKKETNKPSKSLITIISFVLFVFLIFVLYKYFTSPKYYNVLIGDIGGTNTTKSK